MGKTQLSVRFPPSFYPKAIAPLLRLSVSLNVERRRRRRRRRRVGGEGVLVS